MKEKLIDPCKNCKDSKNFCFYHCKRYDDYKIAYHKAQNELRKNIDKLF